MKTQSKAVIYCRVSTKEQVEEGNSLGTQERNCREYCQKNEYEIARVFIEEGESAKTAERTELQNLLRYCSDKKTQVKVVVIYKIDRLSRNTDDYSQIRILLKRYGIEIKSTSEYFENTPAGRFMENIIANVAQFDNDVRTERSVGGMKDAVREGRYIWMAPIGYKNEKVNGKKSIVQTEKAELVKLAFEVMAERNYSVDEIRKKLASQGLHQAKSQFYKMLRNELYAGWICKFGERNRGNYKPIVSEELFKQVQQMMSKKKIPLLYKNKHPDFPLRRFITDQTGIKLTGAWSKGRHKKYAYYRFIRTKQQWPKKDLETIFMAYLDKHSFNRELFENLKTEIIAKLSVKSDKNIETMNLLSSKRAELKEKQNKLIEKSITGIISDVILKEQLAAIEEELWSIDKILLQKNENKVDIEKILAFVHEFITRPSLVWQKMPVEIRIKLQWFVFPNGVLFDGVKFRTTKLSSLFKLKQFFLPEMSPNVNYPRLNYKHENPANFSSLHSTEPVLWEEIKHELVMLEKIINTSESQEKFPTKV